MGKVLNSKGIIRKRNYIEKRLHGERIYMERKHTRKGDCTEKELHGGVITLGRDYTGR